MARKSTSHSYSVITAGSMAGSLTSSTTNVAYTDNIGYHCVWTGSPVGTITVEASIDGTNWDSLTLNPTISTGGAASSTLISLNQVPYEMLRVKYNRTSGTGTLNVVVMTKSVGA